MAWLAMLMLPNASTEAVGQCAIDVCGYWYSENYNSGVPVEYVAIDLIDDQLVCVKMLGDPFVPTGHVTWEGAPLACTFQGSMYATTGWGAQIVPIPATINILSDAHITVNSMAGLLHFFPTTLEHLEYIGIDHTEYPLGCVPCETPIPNVFTPNGDGVNDLLSITCGLSSHLFSVKDRWGNTVYETSAPDPAWDGRNGWDPCPEGVYFWSLITTDDMFGKVRSGVVHLLR